MLGNIGCVSGQRRLQGAAEQLIRFQNVRQTFELRLCRHITNAVILQVGGVTAAAPKWCGRGHDRQPRRERGVQTLRVWRDSWPHWQGLREGENGASAEPWKPHAFHVSLLRYKPLMEWLKESNPIILQQLSKVRTKRLTLKGTWAWAVGILYIPSLLCALMIASHPVAREVVHRYPRQFAKAGRM